MPYGIATPFAIERKSWSLTASFCRAQTRPGFLKRPTNSLFLVSTLKMGLPRRPKRSRSCAMVANWASRSGGEPFEIFFLWVYADSCG